jgi:hypothetical protein
LLNLPYFLVSQIEKYLLWFQEEVDKKMNNTSQK